jgi:hypothetical protein
VSRPALWELHGVGHVNRLIVGDSAVIKDAAEGTSVIGAWDQYGLIDVVEGLKRSGFVLHSLRRLDVADWIR